ASWPAPHHWSRCHPPSPRIVVWTFRRERASRISRNPGTPPEAPALPAAAVLQTVTCLHLRVAAKRGESVDPSGHQPWYPSSRAQAHGNYPSPQDRAWARARRRASCKPRYKNDQLNLSNLRCPCQVPISISFASSPLLL